jgi:hypothetical protein
MILKDASSSPPLEDIYSELVRLAFCLIDGTPPAQDTHLSINEVKKIFLPFGRPSLGQKPLFSRNRVSSSSLGSISLMELFTDTCGRFFPIFEIEEACLLGNSMLRIPSASLASMKEYVYFGVAPLPEVNSLILDLGCEKKLCLFSDRLISLIVRMAESLISLTSTLTAKAEKARDGRQLGRTQKMALINGWDSFYEAFSADSVKRSLLMQMTLPIKRGEDLSLHLTDDEMQASLEIAKVLLIFLLGHEYAHLYTSHPNHSNHKPKDESFMDLMSLVFLIKNPLISESLLYQRHEIIDIALTLFELVAYGLQTYYGFKSSQHPTSDARVKYIKRNLYLFSSEDERDILLNTRFAQARRAAHMIKCFSANQLDKNHIFSSSEGLEGRLEFGRYQLGRFGSIF